jgi:hypothetical protein
MDRSSDPTNGAAGGESPVSTGAELAMESAAARRRERHRTRSGQSRIANGNALLPGIDGRSAWVRRCKDVIASHISDLGGIDNTSAAERSLVRRAAVLTTELERLEVRFALADETGAGELELYTLELYARMASSLRRLLEAIGLQRRAKDVGASLADLLREDQERRRRQEWVHEPAEDTHHD